MAMLSRDAFGVKLDAVNRQVAVTESHDMAVITGCIDDQISRDIVNNQRVIARCSEGASPSQPFLI